MPFSNGGYYNYSGLRYNAGQTTGVSIHNSPLGPQGRLPEQEFTIHNEAGAWYDLQGRKLAGRPTQKGVYINKGKKQVVISRWPWTSFELEIFILLYIVNHRK